MALSINRTLRDGASTASFEVVNDGVGVADAATIIDVSSLSGTGGTNNTSVIIKRVIATVANQDDGVTSSFVTLSWGDGTEFLHLPVGVTDLDLSFSPISTADDDGDVTLATTASTLFTLRIYVVKSTGFPLSMGDARNRP
jgi:hypothetical protein